MTDHDPGGSSESSNASSVNITVAYQFGSVFSHDSRFRSTTQSERLKFEFKDGLMLLVEMSLAYGWITILERSEIAGTNTFGTNAPAYPKKLVGFHRADGARKRIVRTNL